MALTQEEENEVLKLQEEYDALYAELQSMKTALETSLVAEHNRKKHIQEMSKLADKINSKAQKIMNITRRAVARKGH